MNVKECMAKDVISVAHDVSLAEASSRMLDANVGFLPVVDGKRLIGVITDRDLVVRGLAENKSPIDTPIHDLMSIEIVCCFEDQTVEDAKRLMTEHGLKRIPVIDHEHNLLGVISRAQLGLPDESRKKPVKVTFQKIKTDSYGRPHQVAVRTMYITGAKDKEEATEKAVRHYESEKGTAWSNVADKIEVEEPNADEDNK